jgi:hypothetical protein
VRFAAAIVSIAKKASEPMACSWLSDSVLSKPAPECVRIFFEIDVCCLKQDARKAIKKVQEFTMKQLT